MTNDEHVICCTCMLVDMNQSKIMKKKDSIPTEKVLWWCIEGALKVSDGNTKVVMFLFILCTI